VQESLFLTDHVGVTALHAAVQSARSEDTARALLEGGADVNARTHKGNTPLLFAANAGHHGAAEMLLAAGAAANAQNAADVGVLNKPINQASKNQTKPRRHTNPRGEHHKTIREKPPQPGASSRMTTKRTRIRRWRSKGDHHGGRRHHRYSCKERDVKKLQRNFQPQVLSLNSSRRDADRDGTQQRNRCELRRHGFSQGTPGCLST
jgi:hypothetical protein